MVVACNICGGTQFIPAPNNRLSWQGLPPVCAGCRSLERHRIGYKVVNGIRVRERFLELDLLQLSNDRVVARGWFASAEISMYGGANSIDIQNIDRPDGRYGFIVCSHILEHVADPQQAVRELGRVLSNDGLLYLAYPAPIMRPTTMDWGFPDPAQHGHYRVFGRDFQEQYKELLPDAYTIAVRETDEVTGDQDVLYLVTRDEFWAERILGSPFTTRLIARPGG